MKVSIIPLLFVAISIFLNSCVTEKHAKEAIQQEKVSKPEISENSSPPTSDENAKSEVKSKAVTKKQEEEQPSTNEVKTTQVKKEENFVVTEKVYKKTFDEIKKIILTLNKIISDKDFDSWKDYLTDDYIKKVSNPEYLAKMSSSPILKQQGIVLQSLEDYFFYVVVPSRANARLDKIEIIDKTHVKAITIINGSPIILYRLVNVDGAWKIGVM